MKKVTVNPYQVREKKRQRETKFVFCPYCRRYSWSEVRPGGLMCLECGCIVEEKYVINSNNR